MLTTPALRETRDLRIRGKVENPLVDPHPPRPHPQHRHLRPHRLGQDDAHRAHPLLHGSHPRDSRGPRQRRRRRQDGLDGSRAREGHHDPVRRDVLRVERLAGPVPDAQHQHHRHPRPRRLHHRGRARAPRARRRDPGARLRQGRAEPVDHGRPADEAVPRAAHRLRQQDGQPRRQLRARRGTCSRRSSGTTR